MRFDTLGIIEPILNAVADMGFETPTEVQHLSIPPVLQGNDLIVMSKTGSGKTAAFGIPILQQLEPDAPGPQALILTPTRELAVQVDSDLNALSKYMPVRTTAVYGQHSINVEVEALKKGATVVTGTPGRVFDHIRQGVLVTKHVRFLVLDEADRMLDMGFIDQVVRIIKKLPQDRITLLFSATMPMEVRRICQAYMKQPLTIEIESDTKTVDTIEQVYYRVEKNDKRTQLHRVLTVEQPDSCMIFCNTRAAADRVQEFLTRKGYASQTLHGDIPQARRLKTIQQFRSGDFHLLVATDVAARGIHVEDLSLVINYDVPNEKDSYVHRIGRTGRAGNGGKAITLVSSDDIISLYEIEEHIGAMIPEGELPDDAAVQASKARAAEKWATARMHRHAERPHGEAKSAEGGKGGSRKGAAKKPRAEGADRPPAKGAETASRRPAPKGEGPQGKPPRLESREPKAPKAQEQPRPKAPAPAASPAASPAATGTAVQRKVVKTVVTPKGQPDEHRATPAPAGPAQPAKASLLKRIIGRLTGKA